MHTRLLLYTIIYLFLPLNVLAMEYEPLPEAQTGYIIIDLKTGKTVSARQESTAFIPASTLKCVTAAASLSRLGPDFTFDTPVRYTGNIVADTLHGSLIINGSGDPSLDNSFALQLRSKGITHIDGTVDITTSAPFINPAAMIEDIGTDYGVGWARFNYCANRALVNEEMERFPSAYVTDDFRADLWTAGVTTDNTIIEPADTSMLFIHTSEPLPDLLRHMLFESDNLYAESIGRALSPDLSLSSSIDSVYSYLNDIGVKSGTTRLTDFSGLSRTNLITPLALAQTLVTMSRDRNYVSAFPSAGREGTVKRLLNNTRLAGRMALKSGSMTGVLAYAGYRLDNAGHPTHAVVIIVNNAICRQSEVKQYITRWLLKNF